MQLEFQILRVAILEGQRNVLQGFGVISEVVQHGGPITEGQTQLGPEFGRADHGFGVKFEGSLEDIKENLKNMHDKLIKIYLVISAFELKVSFVPQFRGGAAGFTVVRLRTPADPSCHFTPEINMDNQIRKGPLSCAIPAYRTCIISITRLILPSKVLSLVTALNADLPSLTAFSVNTSSISGHVSKEDEGLSSEVEVVLEDDITASKRRKPNFEKKV